MNNPPIILIAALSENKVLGKDGKLPWHIPEDMKRFRSLTKNHAVIMGRKTYESMGKALPNRINIVVTKNRNTKYNDALVAHSIEEALEKAKQIEKEEIFIIGGGEIYKQSIDLSDKLYLTIIKGEFEGDTYFPDYSQFKKITFKEEHSENGYSYSFINLER